MAQTESTMPALGRPAADFHLPNVVSGATLSLASFAAKQALLVMFISRHCPYVQHVKHELARLGKDYAGRPLAIVAISSNYVVQYPEDKPEHLRAMAMELDLNYPICYDETQEVAKRMTPHARRTSSCMTNSGGWSIAASWMARGRAMTCQSPAQICGRRSTQCWPASR